MGQMVLRIEIFFLQIFIHLSFLQSVSPRSRMWKIKMTVKCTVSMQKGRFPGLVQTSSHSGGDNGRHRSHK